MKEKFQEIVSKALADWVSQRAGATKPTIASVAPKEVKQLATPKSPAKPVVDLSATGPQAKTIVKKKSPLAGAPKQAVTTGGRKTTPLFSFQSKEHPGYSVQYHHAYQEAHINEKGEKIEGHHINTSSGKPVVIASLYHKDVKVGHPTGVEDHHFADVHKKLGYSHQDHLEAAAHLNVLGLKERAKESNLSEGLPNEKPGNPVHSFHTKSGRPVVSSFHTQKRALEMFDTLDAVSQHSRASAEHAALAKQELKHPHHREMVSHYAKMHQNEPGHPFLETMKQAQQDRALTHTGNYHQFMAEHHAERAKASRAHLETLKHEYGTDNEGNQTVRGGVHGALYEHVNDYWARSHNLEPSGKMITDPEAQHPINQETYHPDPKTDFHIKRQKHRANLIAGMNNTSIHYEDNVGSKSTRVLSGSEERPDEHKANVSMVRDLLHMASSARVRQHIAGTPEQAKHYELKHQEHKKELNEYRVNHPTAYHTAFHEHVTDIHNKFKQAAKASAAGDKEAYKQHLASLKAHEIGSPTAHHMARQEFKISTSRKEAEGLKQRLQTDQAAIAQNVAHGSFTRPQHEEAKQVDIAGGMPKVAESSFRIGRKIRETQRLKEESGMKDPGSLQVVSASGESKQSSPTSSASSGVGSDFDTIRGLHENYGVGSRGVKHAGETDTGLQGAMGALWHADQHANVLAAHHAKAGTLYQKDPSKAPVKKPETKILAQRTKSIRVTPSGERIPSKVTLYAPHKGPSANLTMQKIGPSAASGKESTKRLHPNVRAVFDIANTMAERIRAPRISESVVPGGVTTHPDRESRIHSSNLGTSSRSGHHWTSEILAGQMPSQTVGKKPKKWERQAAFEASMPRQEDIAAAKEATKEQHTTSRSHEIAAEKHLVSSAAGMHTPEEPYHVAQAKRDVQEQGTSSSEHEHGTGSSKYEIHPDILRELLHSNEHHPDYENEHHYSHLMLSMINSVYESCLETLQKAESIFHKPISAVVDSEEGRKVGVHGRIKYDYHQTGKTGSGKPIWEAHASIGEGAEKQPVTTNMLHVLHSEVTTHKDLGGGYHPEDHADAMLHHYKRLQAYAKLYHRTGVFNRDKYAHHKAHLLAHHSAINAKHEGQGEASVGLSIDHPIHEISKWEGENKNLFGNKPSATFHPKTVIQEGKDPETGEHYREKVHTIRAVSKFKQPKVSLKEKDDHVSAYLKRAIDLIPTLQKAMTAGYGYAGAPGSMSGGSVLGVESLDHRVKHIKRCEKCNDDVYHYGDTCLNCSFGKEWMPNEFESFKKEVAKASLKSFIQMQLRKGTFDAHHTIAIFESKILPSIMKAKPENHAFIMAHTPNGKPLKVLSAYKRLSEGKDVPKNEDVSVRTFDFDKEHQGFSDVDHVQAVHTHIDHALQNYGVALSHPEGSPERERHMRMRNMNMHSALEHRVRGGDLANTTGATKRFHKFFDVWYTEPKEITT